MQAISATKTLLPTLKVEGKDDDGRDDFIVVVGKTIIQVTSSSDMNLTRLTHFPC